MRKVDAKEPARSREERVLAQWKRDDTFKRSIAQREGRPNFVLYEGPPTANGRPHIGHVLGRVIKDVIGRYKTMSGYRVVRKAGWDTHGLPVELGVEKQLGISGKQEIEAYGVAKFVEACKSSVFEYEKQWRELTDRIAYWVDLDDPYVTLTDEYIESVWHLLSEIHKKGLLYKGHRVSPYCPSCQTTLSSHEVAQGYQQVKDLSAVVKFRSKEGDVTFLAWTTTPWTLPANVALAVNPAIDYVKVRHNGEVYVVAEALADAIFGRGAEKLSVHKGSEFVGISYQPPFDCVRVERGHSVVDADFVSDESGTGIVHLAPAHGEDDYRTVMEKNLDFVSVVDSAGCYTDAVSEFAGRFVKDCDVDIVKQLAACGLLFAKERYEHSYPFCWRCSTPLLYYATESWFIQTTAVKEQLLENNRKIDWHPAHLGDGRFGNFLEELVDWNISRNRYWGTPLNVWICGDCGAEATPGSRVELGERAVQAVDENLELHKPYIDEVKLRCACGGVMIRTPEVIDVWFDSGAMPFAQYHYPFGDQTRFQEQYPADVICEAIDQTRGWFFSLLAVSALYNGQTPYKAVISTGHVLDEDGQKMSKSKGNVIDPWELIERYGADAVRWALLADSVPWNNKRFSKGIVSEAKSKVIDTLQHVHAFYTMYASIDGYRPEDHPQAAVTHELDRWILSRLHSTLEQVTTGLDAYDFLNPAKRIERLIDDLSNWYVRRSRDRFWGSGLSEDKRSAYGTLREVLMTLARIMAPYTPFLAEDLYRNLGGGDSVHLADYPKANERWVDPVLEQEMDAVRRIVELARSIRNASGIKTRQPLSELVVWSERPLALSRFESLLKDEINVKMVRTVPDDSEFTVVRLKLNVKTAGKTYGKRVNSLQRQLSELSEEETRQAAARGWIELEADGELLRLDQEELIVEKQAKTGFASASGNGLAVALHLVITEELKQEGIVREVVRAVQDTRKRLDLPIEKYIDLVLDAEGEVKAALERFESVLRDSVLLNSFQFGTEEGMEYVNVEGSRVGIRIR